jgi:hypothetical protein
MTAFAEWPTPFTARMRRVIGDAPPRRLIVRSGLEPLRIAIKFAGL